MRIYLTTDVPALGHRGSILEVPDGLARNYLLPKRLAELARPEHERRQAAQTAERQRVEADQDRRWQVIVDRSASVNVDLPARANTAGRLYGRVSSTAVLEALRVAGLPLIDETVEFDRSIDTLGSHTATIQGRHGRSCRITVNVHAA